MALRKCSVCCRVLGGRRLVVRASLVSTLMITISFFLYVVRLMLLNVCCSS